MTERSPAVFTTPDADRLDAAADQAIAACGGDAREAVKALIVANVGGGLVVARERYHLSTIKPYDCFSSSGLFRRGNRTAGSTMFAPLNLRMLRCTCQTRPEHDPSTEWNSSDSLAFR